jgi:hypothetical protein
VEAEMNLQEAYGEAQKRFGKMGNVLLDKQGFSIGLWPLKENGVQDSSRPFMRIMTSRASWEDAFQRFDVARQDFWSCLAV